MKPILLLLSFIAAHSILASPHIKHTNINKHHHNKYLFSFVQLSDVHIGEGAPNHDFGTPGYFDEIKKGIETSYPEARLAKAIQWINQHYEQENIRFVFISGDLTESAEKSEFQQLKLQMDSLKVPYIPGIGNHDIWPYIHYMDEAPTSSGDSLLNEIFAPQFEKLRKEFQWDDGTRQQRWLDPESNTYAYLQNYSFSLMGQRFIFLDFNPRNHCNGSPGIGPDTRLTNYKSGTLDYLKNTLKQASDKGEYSYLISHHPPIRQPFGTHYAFSPQEKDTLATVFSPYSGKINGWFAGHIHRWRKYRFFKGKVTVYETKANKAQHDGGFRLVKVYGKP